MGGIELDLAPQAGDAQVDGAVECFHLAMRGGLQQPVALQRPVRVLGEEFQQVELARGERVLAAVGIDQHALVEVEHQAPHADARRDRDHRRAGRPPQHALHPRQELAQLDRLRNVVVGAGLQADHAVDRVGRGRHHDDADAPALLAQPARHRKAVLAGQADVEHDQRGQLAFAQPAQGGAAVDAGDAKILAGEIFDEELALRRLVLDHHDVRGLSQHAPPAAGEHTPGEVFAERAIRRTAPAPAQTWPSRRARRSAAAAAPRLGLRCCCDCPLPQ